VLVLIDGSDSSVAGQAINVTTAIGLDESLRRALVEQCDIGSGDAAKTFVNPDSRSPNFFLPGLTAILLLKRHHIFDGVFHRAGKRTRHAGTIVCLPQCGRWDCCWGKLLPYLGIGFFELCMILTFMRFAFHVPIHGSVFSTGLPFVAVHFRFVVAGDFDFPARRTPSLKRCNWRF